jgi:hypothetical protein
VKKLAAMRVFLDSLPNLNSLQLGQKEAEDPAEPSVDHWKFLPDEFKVGLTELLEILAEEFLIWPA